MREPCWLPVRKEKAMEVFKYNFKAHPEDKFTPNVGLARGYTAIRR
jgi:hypothetical protein